MEFHEPKSLLLTSICQVSSFSMHLFDFEVDTSCQSELSQKEALG